MDFSGGQATGEVLALVQRCIREALLWWQALEKLGCRAGQVNEKVKQKKVKENCEIFLFLT